MVASTATTSRRTRKSKTAPVIHHITLPKGAARPTSCGDLFRINGDKLVVFMKTVAGAPVSRDYAAAEGCTRLASHSGDHKVGSKPRGLMTPAQRRAAATKRTASKRPAKVASKIVTVGGTKFRVFANGKVEPVTQTVTKVTK
jgi:hypothetical protein